MHTYIYICVYIYVYIYLYIYIYTCLSLSLSLSLSHINEGSLEAKLPTLWTDGKAQRVGSRARKKLGRGESQTGEDKRGESQKREDAGARKGRTVAKHSVFPVFFGSGGSKSRLAKAAGAETCGQIRNDEIARRCGAKHILK